MAIESTRRSLIKLAGAACVIGLFQFVTGCTTSKLAKIAAYREDRLLTAHTFEDVRVSVEPREGMVPTGVWRVSGKRSVTYLAATIHLVTTNQIPFPSSYYAAYRDSEEIYVEVNDEESQLSQYRLTLQMMSWMRRNRTEFFYPKGRSLADDLSLEMSQRVQEHYGRDFKKVQTMRPAFLVFMAEAEDMGDQFLEEGGVEDVFLARARKDRKRIRTLDDGSVNEVVLLALDEMIYEIKREIEETGADAVVNEALFGSKEPIDERDWRTGDLQPAQEELQQMQSRAPALYEKIGPERNRKWMPKILAAVNGDRNVMILAGVAHFPGPDGLIALLEKAGCKAEQLYGVDPLRSD
jgi:uncharacterized protein YbaP (TraB family)